MLTESIKEVDLSFLILKSMIQLQNIELIYKLMESFIVLPILDKFTFKNHLYYKESSKFSDGKLHKNQKQLDVDVLDDDFLNDIYCIIFSIHLFFYKNDFTFIFKKRYQFISKNYGKF